MARTPIRRASPPPRVAVLATKETAREAIGTLAPGCSVSGITRGQFSLLDLLEAVLEQTGPADCVLSAWTMGMREAERLASLLSTGEIRGLRLLVDKSFRGRQPEYSRRIEDLFGAAALVPQELRARFFLLQGDRLSVLCRGSLNLTRAKAWDQFDLDADPALVAHYSGVVHELAESLPEGWRSTPEAIANAFATAGGGRPASVPASTEPDDPENEDDDEDPGIAEAVVGASPRFKWWRGHLKRIDEAVTAAKRDRTWSAVAQLLGRREATYREMVLVEERLLAEATGDGAAMTEEAFLALFDERVSKLPTPYLERAVAEYLDRHPGLSLAHG